MKTKTNTRKSCYCLMLVSIILLIGCTRVVIVERNNTIYINRTINHTITINNTISLNNTIPCNTTGPELNISFDRSYTLELIRRIKYLEGRQDRYWNDTECHYDLNKSNYELIECEEELCEFNLTWC